MQYRNAGQIHALTFAEACASSCKRLFKMRTKRAPLHTAAYAWLSQPYVNMFNPNPPVNDLLRSCVHSMEIYDCS